MKSILACTTLSIIFFVVSLRSVRGHTNEEERVWVLLESDDAKELLSSRLLSRAPGILQEGNITLVHTESSKLSLIKDVLRERKGCGGFKTFSSLDEAETYAAKFMIGFGSEFETPFIDNPEVALSLGRSVSTNEMKRFINSFVGSFKNRWAHSSYGIEASDWLYQQWFELTSPRTDIDISKFNHSRNIQSSIILTIHGSTNSDNDIIIFGAHLDSILNRPNPVHEEMTAPGADDDASGITILNEVIRAIVETNYKPDKTIQIMAYANEEIGILGSQEIAKKYKRKGINVLGMLNFDMVGYNGNKDGVVCFNSDNYNNREQIDFLKKLMETYLPEIPYGYTKCDYGCSDHAPWTEEGFPANLIDECELSPYYHSTGDTLVNVDVNQMSSFAKLAVVYISEIAKGEIEVTQCINTDNGATDDGGDSCDWYDDNSNRCGDYDDDDFTADTMCCACQNNGKCFNTDNGATDDGGDSCDWYADNSHRCGYYDDDDFTANLMCCACQNNGK